MEHTRFSREEVGRRGEELYARSIRSQVETAPNIGKMVIIDVETGDYEVGDDMGIEAARRLQTRHANAALYGIRIGYNVAAALGGVMERTVP
jgi:hypothetical protein